MEPKKLIDGAMLLAVTTAALYFFHFLYLYYYYQYYHVALVELHYSLQDVLMVNPFLITTLIASAAVVAFVLLIDLQSITNKVTPPPAKRGRFYMYGLLAALVLSILLTNYGVKFEAEEDAAFTSQSAPFVEFSSTHDSSETGYRYLARSEDYFYFFKKEGDTITTVAVRVDDVKKLTLQKELPKTD